jgi:hypothetical protein
MNMYGFLADAVVVLHAAYVCFIVFGLLAILLGVFIGWRWVRSFWFRTVHLVMIAIVALEAAFGVRCPLTVLENHWREAAGEMTETGSFMGRLAHNLIFIDAPPWIFPVLHISFGAIVLATFILAPPQWPWRKLAKDV